MALIFPTYDETGTARRQNWPNSLHRCRLLHANSPSKEIGRRSGQNRLDGAIGPCSGNSRLRGIL